MKENTHSHTNARSQQVWITASWQTLIEFLLSIIHLKGQTVHVVRLRSKSHCFDYTNEEYTACFHFHYCCYSQQFSLLFQHSAELDSNVHVKFHRPIRELSESFLNAPHNYVNRFVHVLRISLSLMISLSFGRKLECNCDTQHDNAVSELSMNLNCSLFSFSSAFGRQLRLVIVNWVHVSNLQSFIDTRTKCCLPTDYRCN